MQLQVVGEIALARDGYVLAVDDAADGGLLLGDAVDAGREEVRGHLEAVHDAAREVGVFGGTPGKAGMCELDQDGVLAAEEEDGLWRSRGG